MKENNVKNDPMRELTNKHLIEHQEVARIRMKEYNNGKGDQMKDLDYQNLIEHKKRSREKSFL